LNAPVAALPDSSAAFRPASVARRLRSVGGWSTSPSCPDSARRPVMGDNRCVTTTRRTTKADGALASAVDEVREMLAGDVGAAEFGDHLGVHAEDDRVVTHFFAATMPGY